MAFQHKGSQLTEETTNILDYGFLRKGLSEKELSTIHEKVEKEKNERRKEKQRERQRRYRAITKQKREYDEAMRATEQILQYPKIGPRPLQTHFKLNPNQNHPQAHLQAPQAHSQADPHSHSQAPSQAYYVSARQQAPLYPVSLYPTPHQPSHTPPYQTQPSHQPSSYHTQPHQPPNMYPPIHQAQPQNIPHQAQAHQKSRPSYALDINRISPLPPQPHIQQISQPYHTSPNYSTGMLFDENDQYSTQQVPLDRVLPVPEFQAPSDRLPSLTSILGGRSTLHSQTANFEPERKL
eukprot:TRINITY_DN671_c0_g1_i1.p1 TRINITY_DN671_c0_g1~~TRINITY_DN671_c0_g1_i1.p1  ORF type:complete len:294 (-),score=33.46 TRINITY_DN671_c0_g1_i1:11-892(-)